jgi:hypothetical protein
VDKALKKVYDKERHASKSETVREADRIRGLKYYYAHKNDSLLKKRERTALQKGICYQHYGGYKCQCPGCDFKGTDPAFFTLDHINNDGNEFRAKKRRTGTALYWWLIKNDFPEDIQVLCWNCNCAKSVNGGVCPHVHKEK